MAQHNKNPPPKQNVNKIEFDCTNINQKLSESLSRS